MSEPKKPTLPPNIKPDSLTAYVWELGQENDRMPVQDMVDRINKKFPGNTYARQTILALRSQFGIRERNAPTPSNTKSAAPKRRGKDKQPRKGTKTKKRAGSKPAEASDGHPAVTRIVADDAAAAYRKLVARIGTDAARKHLEEIEKVL
jgi:hypothetical protein